MPPGQPDDRRLIDFRVYGLTPVLGALSAWLEAAPASLKTTDVGIGEDIGFVT